ncbi:hypothetical protein SBRCBS47491_005849 [Sporothrix bragantina]|uniref:D-mandelate dehydrogenase n=1 Tax=Sporothrix bragantina TaxID=671064 RepID=A0ABP0C024_9PEZI
MAEPFNTPVSGPTPVPGATPVIGTPVPGATPRATSPVHEVQETTTKPIVLHIGDPIRYNPETYAEFERHFTIVRPERAERQRPGFVRGLREGRWGNFAAIFRPFWGSGGEMGDWDAELISLLPASCRVFASAGAGFDWADTKLLGERGIIYCNSGLAAAEAVSDFAVAMVISTFRHLAWCIAAASVSSQTFRVSHNTATGLSHNLRGHVLGLIGMGNIGQSLAAKLGCVAFGMQIHYYDVVRKPEALEKELGATYHATLSGLLGASDCVVLCTPASIDGKPLLTREAIALMKPGARFVNVARGSLVDEEALAEALEDPAEERVSEASEDKKDIRGRLSAAAIDVHANEPTVNPRLLRLASLEATTATISSNFSAVPARLMLTCHNAGGTVETHQGFEELCMRNILAVLNGRPALTPVNLQYLK